jgi:hypothetical protein
VTWNHCFTWRWKGSHSINTKSFYFLDDGILMRSWRNRNVPNVPNMCVTQIVVPKVLRVQLLNIAHDIPASGHLDVKKTLQRLQSHFISIGVRYVVM